jgi:hypothetical protein
VTVELREFIEQRIAEDEAWARAASQPYPYAADSAKAPEGGVHWTWTVGDNYTPVTPDPAVDDTVGGPEEYGRNVSLISVEEWPTESSDHGWPAHSMPRRVATEMVEVDSSAAGHIVRHDPARVLRDVEAKRRILAAYVDDDRVRFGAFESCSDSCPRQMLDEVVKLLAMPHDQHPDYREDWRP